MFYFIYVFFCLVLASDRDVSVSSFCTLVSVVGPVLLVLSLLIFEVLPMSIIYKPSLWMVWKLLLLSPLSEGGLLLIVVLLLIWMFNRQTRASVCYRRHGPRRGSSDLVQQRGRQGVHRV